MEERRVYELQAEVYKILSNPTRLMILDCLRGKEKTVGEIVKCLNQNKSNVSQHLNYMKAVGVLCSRKEGKKVYYYISDERLLRAMDMIKRVLFERFVQCGRMINGEEVTRLFGRRGNPESG